MRGGAEYNEEIFYGEFMILSELSGKLYEQLIAFVEGNDMHTLP